MLLAFELLQKNFKNPTWPPFKGHNPFSHEQNSVDSSQDTQGMLQSKWYKYQLGTIFFRVPLFSSLILPYYLLCGRGASEPSSYDNERPSAFRTCRYQIRVFISGCWGIMFSMSLKSLMIKLNRYELNDPS